MHIGIAVQNNENACDCRKMYFCVTAGCNICIICVFCTKLLQLFFHFVSYGNVPHIKVETRLRVFL